MSKPQITLRLLFGLVFVGSISAWYASRYFKPAPVFQPHITFRFASDGRRHTIIAKWFPTPGQRISFVDHEPLGELDYAMWESPTVGRSTSPEFAALYKRIYRRMELETELLSQKPQVVGRGEPPVLRSLRPSEDETRLLVELVRQHEVETIANDSGR